MKESTTKIERLGDDEFLIRIPDFMCESLGIQEGTPLDIEIIDGKIHITKAQS